MAIHPRAKVVEHRPGGPGAPLASLLGGVAGARGFALDGEEAGDDAHAFERDAVARARRLDEPPARMSLIGSPR